MKETRENVRSGKEDGRGEELFAESIGTYIQVAAGGGAKVLAI